MYTITELKMLRTSKEDPVYIVKITADKAADIPQPRDCWAAGSELEVLENGGSKYKLSNSREWVQINFNKGGGGNSEESFVEFDDSGRNWVTHNIYMFNQNSKAIIGKDGFYIPAGFGAIDVIPFDGAQKYSIQAIDSENTQCRIEIISYGNGVYLGVDNSGGYFFTSEDARNWNSLGDVHIDPQTVTNIIFSDGDFIIFCNNGAVGECLKRENYNRVVENTMDYTTAMGETFTATNCIERFGCKFFATEQGIVYGGNGDGYKNVQFTEDSPEDIYSVSSMCFFCGCMMIFEEMTGGILYRNARFPADVQDGYFYPTELEFTRLVGSIQEVQEIKAICTHGDYMYVFCREIAYRINRDWDITLASSLENYYTMHRPIQNILVSDKSILICCDTEALQFVFK